MENKSFNIVVLHKQSGWSKFKRRLSSWFSSDETGEPRVVPEIIVTSHEDVPGNIISLRESLAFFSLSHFTKQTTKKFDWNQQRLKQHITRLQTVILRNIIYKPGVLILVDLSCTICGTCYICHVSSWYDSGRVADQFLLNKSGEIPRKEETPPSEAGAGTGGDRQFRKAGQEELAQAHQVRGVRRLWLML